MTKLFQKVFDLHFAEQPPYDEIIESLNKLIRKVTKFDANLQPIPHKFEWEKERPSNARVLP